MSWIEAAVRWYAVLAVLSWAFAPGIAWLGDALSDRGLTIARPLAMLAAVYPVWLLASLHIIAFNAAPVVVVVLLVGGSGWLLRLRNAGLDRIWLRQLLVVEAWSLALFAAYVWLRGYTPAILGTEKPMDMAFLASSGRTVSMPPPDPWFAGEPINYYYLGYLLHGTVGRLAGVAPEIGFNLALATVFSVSLVAGFGVVWNITRPLFGARLACVAGLFAAFGVGLAGNLYTPLRLLIEPSDTIAAWWWDSNAGIGWRSSRIVCDGIRVDNNCPFPATETINEFPFFSFLLGDLHPHLMSLPYTLVAIALAWLLAQSGFNLSAVGRRMHWIRVAICGAIVGAHYALNAWDYPTFLLLIAAGAWIGAGSSLARAGRSTLLLVGSSLAAWLPFLATFAPPMATGFTMLPNWMANIPVFSRALSSVGFHSGERTSLAEYLTIFGIPYLFGVALLLINGSVGTPRDSGSKEWRLLAAIILPSLILGVLLAAPVLPLCGVPLALAIVQLRREMTVSPRLFALILYVFVWALSIGVELVYVKDAFDNRMNTLFKFYYQAWTLSAVAAAIALAVIWVATAKVRWQRAILVGAAMVAIVAGAAYPMLASYQWTDRFVSWWGLDGLAYGEVKSPGDVAAIRWLSGNVEPGDILLEAAGCSYHPFGRLPFNRISAFTGIPTAIGWDNHERQWRAGQPEALEQIARRQEDVASMMADPESGLFEKYGITWLIVGDYEVGNWRSECPTAGPYATLNRSALPGASWDEVFASDQTRIYRRRDS